MKIDFAPGWNGLAESLNPKKEEAPKSFEDLLKQEITRVDRAQKEAEDRLVALATGKDPDLVGVSLSLTKAELSFRFLLQVRNKILEAYQEIMRMQL
ncbi:MAG: flagellar hook-basal body complex protein FliE [Thermodesulfobacteria bacterium]|nr:flagellar hook-basal body complex protein FliE [Thermodesulfobacteriota bacterium]